MFSKGQLNRVLKWEKPWQIYLHARMALAHSCAIFYLVGQLTRMAPTWPLLEEQNTEKCQQASLERWFYGPLAGKPTSPFRLRHNFGLRSFLAPVSFCCLMAASVCSGHQHFSQVIPVPSFKTSSFVISDWRLYWRDSCWSTWLFHTKPVWVLPPQSKNDNLVAFSKHHWWSRFMSRMAMIVSRMMLVMIMIRWIHDMINVMRDASSGEAAAVRMVMIMFMIMILMSMMIMTWSVMFDNISGCSWWIWSCEGWWAWWEMRLVQERLLLEWSGWDLGARHMPVTDRPASTPDLPGESTTLNHLKPKIRISVFHFLSKKTQGRGARSNKQELTP